MSKTFKLFSVAVIVVIIATCFGVIIIKVFGNKKSMTTQNQLKNNQIVITSSVFKNNSLIPSKYTCDGDNISSSLEISGVSELAKSLVLIVDDPDAPSGLWTHWIVWNIDPKLKKIAERAQNIGVEGVGSSGKIGYDGPCPPSGTHRYFFKLYALDTELNLEPNSKVYDLNLAMDKHIVGLAEFIGLYSRKK